jgi:hypothetical protein
MKRSYFSILVVCMIVIFMIVAALQVAKPLVPASTAPDPQVVVMRAWELVKQSGSYHFVAQVDQVSIPLSIPINVGKESRQQSVRLEGTADLAEHQMEFNLNAQGGSPLDTRSGTQIKIDGDHAYSRQGEQAWQEIDDFTGSFAPQSDFMAFLSGAKDIRLAEPGSDSAGVPGVTQYNFEVDGRGFAAYLQERLIEQLTTQGKLPVGVEVSLNEQLASLSGTGEIWIRADGLPMRQVLHLQFPPTSQEQTQADVQVTFTDFAPLPGAGTSSMTPLEELHEALGTQGSRNVMLATIFLALLGLALLLGLRHKPVYVAIVITLIAAMIVGPILQSAQAAAYIEGQFTQAQAQQQRQQAAELGQSINTTPAARVEPNISPLETTQAAQKVAEVEDSVFSPISQPASQAALPSVTDDANLDSDGDGLTDEEEALLGTDPTLEDTDGDTLSDYVEVNGFQTSDGTPWYGDPLSKDTNQDSIGDNREWNLDTDGDNIPDLWDNDNDGDQVPDKPDLSPFEQGVKNYAGDTPFTLSFTDLTPNTPTYVEIQVRPVNSDHLRYAFAVRDWPENDLSGQIMDEDGKTFKDVNPESDDPQDAYGDVKLIPMLEIQISGDPTNLPDETTLKNYGISVRDLNSSGDQKAAYVPLQVVTDTGDNQVAYYGKMIYLPASTWGNPQLVRLVWLVQALVDICAEDGLEDGECNEFETYNELEVIQTYYDDFTLTGLNVREDHGTKWAVVYKDPAAITESPKTDRINQIAPLSDLAFGLDRTFLAGRVDKDGNRDFPVTEIKRRFDHTQNADVKVAPDRFNIKDNILLVNEYPYSHIDLGYSTIAITETKKILDVYTPYWSASQPITPTIMFAHEEYYRPLNLDSMGAYSNITVSPDGSQYSLSLPSSVPSGSNVAPIVLFTATALNWAPFVYQDGEWKGAPLDDYLEGLRTLYPPETIDPDPETGEGGLMFLQTYYANIYQGFFSVVEEGEEHIVSPIEETDETIAQYMEDWEMVYEPIKIGMETFFELAIPYHTLDFIGWITQMFNNLYFKITGIGGQSEWYSIYEYEHISKGAGVGLAAECVAALAWLVTHLPPVKEKLDEHIWGKLLIVSISASFAVLAGIKAITANARHARPHAHLNGAKSAEFGVIGQLIVTAILIAVDIAIFIYVMVTNQDLNGVQVGLMVATLIAQIIVVLIFAFISLIPTIGPIIVAIYNLINTFLTEFFGINFTESLIAAITEILYNVHPMVSLAPTVGETVFGFLTEQGISVGNGVNITFPMDVLARQEDPQTQSEYAHIGTDIDYLYGTRVSLDIDDNLSAVTSNSQWKDTEKDHTYRDTDVSGNWFSQDMYRAHAYLTGTLDKIEFTESGVNRSFSYDSEFHYKTYFYRCILFIFCKAKTTKGSVEEEDPNLIFDVLPADIDQLYAWDWNTGSTLPAPQDYDNDGLLAAAYHGSDTDDTQWDRDGDHRSDAWELDKAATLPEDGGFAFDPTRIDTDGDGLNDDEESLLGTDPTLVDSDGDGRSDRDEVKGYLFAYAPGKSTLVRSSPLTVDTDSDGMDDKVEYDLYQLDPVHNLFNPVAWNTSPLSLQVEAGVSGYVYPGATFPLTITLQNSIDTPIKGDVTTQLPAYITPINPATQSFEVLGQDTTILTNNINVDLKTPSTSLKIRSKACGTPELPLVHLPFDEPAASNTFVNQMAPGVYDATCINQLGCPTAGVTGHIGNAVRFSSNTQHLVLDQSDSDLEFSAVQPFSISVWVNPDEPTHSDPYTILGKSDNQSDFTHGYNLYLYPNGAGGYYIGFNNEAKEYHYLSTVSPNTWHHIVATSDGDNLRVYLDGTEVSGTDTGLNPAYLGPSTSPVSLGGIDWSTQGITTYYKRAFLGYVDNLFLYDRVLTDLEISDLANAELALAPGAQQEDNLDTCQLSASQEITVTVDIDSPGAQITSLTDGAWLNGSDYLVVGGEAHDPTSFIDSVQVSVDGGAYMAADGKESWTYLWDKRNLAAGAHTLDVRAFDPLGSYTNTPNRITVNIDRTAPWVNYSSTSLNVARFQDVGNWYFTVSGRVGDTGSGVTAVEALLDGGPDLPYGGWQIATLDPATENWTLDYKLPINVVDLKAVPNPSGNYTLTLRATDKAGNIITSNYPVMIDNNAPLVSLTNPSPEAVITEPLTLSGIISDTATVSSLSVAVVPLEQAEVTEDAALVMHLNEPLDSSKLSFLDASRFNQTGYSDPGHTPDAVHMPGKVDESVYFTSPTSYIRWREPLKTPFTNALTVALWFNTKGPVENTTLLSLDHAAELYWNAGGSLVFSITDSNGLTSETTTKLSYADGGWHHVIGTWDGYVQSIYIDGAQAGFAKPTGMGLLDTSTSLLTLGNSAAGVNGFYGSIDEVMLFPRCFTTQEVANLYHLGNIAWDSATVNDPNSAVSTWSYTLPSGLEGLYEIELRGTDDGGNRNDDRKSWTTWQGEIDMLAPRLSLSTIDQGLTTQVTCSSTDFNLSKDNYQCPCTVLDGDESTYDQANDWYREVIADNTRLYRIRSTCSIESGTPLLLQACDIYGNCSVAEANSNANANSEDASATEEPASPQVSLTPTSAVVAPRDHTVLTDLNPVLLTLRAEAYSGLSEIILTMDGDQLTTFSYPDPYVTGVITTTTWTPEPDLADGAHIFQSIASDWTDQVQAELYPISLILDTLPPSVDISPTVITATRQSVNGIVTLGGPVSDLAGISQVQVALQDASGQFKPAKGPPGAENNIWNPASVIGDQWSYPWRPDAGVDGQVYNVAVQASDLGAHTALAASPVLVDIVAPSAITITLNYVDSSGALAPISAGQTITDVLNPTLQLTWTPATDGSGVRRYWAGLSQQDSPDLTSLMEVSSERPLQVSQASSEAQAYTAFVVAEDIYGNLSWNRFGPIYIDTPLTPDLIALPPSVDGALSADIYHGWMDSGESQIGINRIVADNVPPGFSLNSDQKFYLSWDEVALRIAWLGANWDSEGDLFIYLKTGSGQASDQAYNPYPATSADTLTLPFPADTLLWVTDTQSARLLRWNGADWYDALPGGLGPEFFHFTARSPKSVTDLYLPFTLLGISDPASAPLDLVAFGSQEQALRLWTVFPITNPHNSRLLSKLLDLLPDQHNLVLKHAFHWPNLGLNQSPNRSRFNDVDVRSLLVSDPIGVISDTRKSGLYLSKLFHFNPTAPLIGNGQVITYTLDYLNIGGVSLPGDHLTLVITSTLTLKLPDGQLITRPDGTQVYHQTIDLGPIQQGTNGNVQFNGVVDVYPVEIKYQLCLRDHPDDPEACQSLDDQLHDTSLEAVLATTYAPEVEINRFSVRHPVVVDPPVDVAIVSLQDQTQSSLLSPNGVNRGIIPADIVEQALASPPIYVRSGVNTLQGSAHDPSGVSGAVVQILDPSGDITNTPCNITAPMSGEWSCAVNLQGGQNDLRYYARARASNPFGYTSDWSPWRVLVVDLLPPTITLDSASEATLTAAVIGPGKITLSGQIEDNDQVKNVEVCKHSPDTTALVNCKSIELNVDNLVNGTWSITLMTPPGMDYISYTMHFYAWDAAGNRSAEPLEYTLWVDTVAPEVTVDTKVGTISLYKHMHNPLPVLAGTASDGSGTVDIVVRMTAPGYGTQRSVIPVDNNYWSYTPEINAVGAYSLLLEARDAAGNLTTLGTWTLIVNEGYKFWMPIIYRE